MMKLLVVDDSDLIRSRLTAFLRDLVGIDSVKAVATLAQAVDEVSARQPALLILDLHLSDGSALQILETLKNIAPDMRIFMLSNDASRFSRTRCMQAGADAFYDKSREFEQLLQDVRHQAELSLDPMASPLLF